MAEHVAKSLRAEQLSPSDIMKELRAEPGIGVQLLEDSEAAVIPLGDTPSLSPFVYDSGAELWQRLRAIVTPPEGDKPDSYGVVEVRGKNGAQDVVLTRIAGEDEVPHIYRAVYPGHRFSIAEGRTWKSSVASSASNGGVLGVKHDGLGATEVIAPTNNRFQGSEHYIAPETWAVSPQEISEALQLQQ